MYIAVYLEYSVCLLWLKMARHHKVLQSLIDAHQSTLMIQFLKGISKKNDRMSIPVCLAIYICLLCLRMARYHFFIFASHTSSSRHFDDPIPKGDFKENRMSIAVYLA